MNYIILDRDGVINEHGTDHVRSPDDWYALPGSLEAIARLNRASYRVFVITNQSGIARQYYSVEQLHATHQRMHEAVRQVGGHIDGVWYCPHGPWEDCSCRLPSPGLLAQLEERLGHSLAGIPFVGDKLRTVQAALAVGAQPILVKSGHGAASIAKHRGLEKTPTYDTLAAYVDQLLEGNA